MLNQEKLLYKKKTERGLVEIWQKDERRWLNIDAIEQCGINVEQPDILLSSLHQAFMAALLFIDEPKKVLLAGMGGGVFARFIHHVNPSVQGDSVEINKDVSVLAKQYFDYPQNKWSINVDDIKNWQGSNYDLIIVDIADSDRTPEWLISEKMLQQFKKQLSKSGVLVVNLLVDDADAFRQSLVNVRKIFDRQSLCLPVIGHKNIVVFAFNQYSKNYNDDEFQLHIKSLDKTWGLDFSILFEQLKKDNPKGSMAGVF